MKCFLFRKVQTTMAGKLIDMDDIEWDEAHDAIFNYAMALDRIHELNVQLEGDDGEEVSPSGQKLSEDDLVLLQEHKLLHSRRAAIKECVEATKSFREDMDSKLQNGILSLVAKDAKDKRDSTEKEEMHGVVMKTAENSVNLVKLILASSCTLLLHDQQRILLEFAKPNVLKDLREALVDRKDLLKQIDECEPLVEKCLKEMDAQMANVEKMHALSLGQSRVVQPKQVQQSDTMKSTRKRQMSHAPPAMQSTTGNAVNTNNNGSTPVDPIEDVEMKNVDDGEQMDQSMEQPVKEKADEVGDEEANNTGDEQTPIRGRGRPKSAAVAKSAAKEKPATASRGRGASKAKVVKTPTTSKTPVAKKPQSRTPKGRKGKKQAEVETETETEEERETEDEEGDQTPATATKKTKGSAAKPRARSTASRKSASAASVADVQVADVAAAPAATASDAAAIPTTTPKGRKAPRARVQHYVEVQVSELKKTAVDEMKELEEEAKEAAAKEMEEVGSGKTQPRRRSTRRSGK